MQREEVSSHSRIVIWTGMCPLVAEKFCPTIR